jgi:hypothetical protein
MTLTDYYADAMTPAELADYEAVKALSSEPPGEAQGGVWKTNWVDQVSRILDAEGEPAVDDFGNPMWHGSWSATINSRNEMIVPPEFTRTGATAANGRLAAPPAVPPPDLEFFAGAWRGSCTYRFTDDPETQEGGDGIEVTSAEFAAMRPGWLEIAEPDENQRLLYDGGGTPYAMASENQLAEVRSMIWLKTDTGTNAAEDITRTYLKMTQSMAYPDAPPQVERVQVKIPRGQKVSPVLYITAAPGEMASLLPVEILIPEVLKDADGYYHETPGKLVNTNQLAIGTLENSFKSTTEPLKDDWIEADPDRFYIRISNPAWAGKGVVKVRVWTQGVESDNADERIRNAHNDDDRSTPDSEVIDLLEAANTGEFKSKSMLLTSNDGDDQHPVDGIADNAKNDRTRKIELDGKLKVELLEGKQAATYQADIEAQVPTEKTVKVTVFVAKDGNGEPVASEAQVGIDFRVLSETMAQAGVKVVRNDPAGDNSYVVKFKPSDAGVSLSGGLGWCLPTGGDSFTSTDHAEKLLDWIDRWFPRQAGEIRCIYVNRMKNFNRGGLTFRDADFQATPKYAGTIWIETDSKTTYVPPHEMMHVLLNAVHDDYQIDYANKRTTWRNFYPEEGIYGSKRIHKHSRGVDIGGKLRTQKDVMISSSYAK